MPSRNINKLDIDKGPAPPLIPQHLDGPISDYSVNHSIMELAMPKNQNTNEWHQKGYITDAPTCMHILNVHDRQRVITNKTHLHRILIFCNDPSSTHIAAHQHHHTSTRSFETKCSQV